MGIYFRYMKYITTYTKNTSCDHCGRGIKNVVELESEGVRVGVGIDCAAKLLHTSSTTFKVLARKRDEQVERAKLFFERDNPTLVKHGNGKYVFKPNTNSEVDHYNKKVYSEDFISTHFPEYA